MYKCYWWGKECEIAVFRLKTGLRPFLGSLFRVFNPTRVSVSTARVVGLNDSIQPERLD